MITKSFTKKDLAVQSLQLLTVLCSALLPAIPPSQGFLVSLHNPKGMRGVIAGGVEYEMVRKLGLDVKSSLLYHAKLFLALDWVLHEAAEFGAVQTAVRFQVGKGLSPV
jgi:hypothetical protein